MPNIYQHIDENKRNTWIVMGVFVAVVTAIGWFIGEYLGGYNGVTYVAIALIISGISGFISYYNSDSIILAISGAKEVTKEQNPYLHNLVENMSIASGLPKPKIYMIQDSAMNAFATGRDPNHSALCFTSGIVQRLEKRELEGVIAHEMAHIGNYDIRLMSIVSILVGTVTLLADWITRGTFYRSRKRDDKSEINTLVAIIGFLLIALSPVIATLIKLAISRRREYLADATSALITRYPKGLANALRKLATDREVLESANGATAHLYISNPLKGGHGISASLFSTHPPIEDRIRRLEEM